MKGRVQGFEAVTVRRAIPGVGPVPHHQMLNQRVGAAGNVNVLSCAIRWSRPLNLLPVATAETRVVPPDATTASAGPVRSLRRREGVRAERRKVAARLIGCIVNGRRKANIRPFLVATYGDGAKGTRLSVASGFARAALHPQS